MQTTVGDSARSDSSTAFLSPAATSRPNLDVLLQTQVISLVRTASPATFRGVNFSQGPDCELRKPSLHSTGFTCRQHPHTHSMQERKVSYVLCSPHQGHVASLLPRHSYSFRWDCRDPSNSSTIRYWISNIPAEPRYRFRA